MSSTTRRGRWPAPAAAQPADLAAVAQRRAHGAARVGRAAAGRAGAGGRRRIGGGRAQQREQAAEVLALGRRSARRRRGARSTSLAAGGHPQLGVSSVLAVRARARRRPVSAAMVEMRGFGGAGRSDALVAAGRRRTRRRRRGRSARGRRGRRTASAGPPSTSRPRWQVDRRSACRSPHAVRGDGHAGVRTGGRRRRRPAAHRVAAWREPLASVSTTPEASRAGVRAGSRVALAPVAAVPVAARRPEARRASSVAHPVGVLAVLQHRAQRARRPRSGSRSRAPRACSACAQSIDSATPGRLEQVQRAQRCDRAGDLRGQLLGARRAAGGAGSRPRGRSRGARASGRGSGA